MNWIARIVRWGDIHYVSRTTALKVPRNYLANKYWKKMGESLIGLTCTDCHFNGEGHVCSLRSASVVVSDEGVDSSRFSIAHAIPPRQSTRLCEYMAWDAFYVINQWHTWGVRPWLRGYWQLLCTCHASPRVSQTLTPCIKHLCLTTTRL